MTGRDGHRPGVVDFRVGTESIFDSARCPCGEPLTESHLPPTPVGGVSRLGSEVGRHNFMRDSLRDRPTALFPDANATMAAYREEQAALVAGMEDREAQLGEQNRSLTEERDRLAERHLAAEAESKERAEDDGERVEMCRAPQNATSSRWPPRHRSRA